MSARRIAGGGGRPIGFRFDGRDFTGRDGDTIASALLANGVRIVGRSFKYHRPRGIFGAWTEEPNALVDVTICRRDDAEPARHDRAAGRRHERANPSTPARPPTPTATASSTASRGSSPPASTTRRSCGRTGIGSSRASARWPGSVASIPPTSRPPARRISTQAATCWWSAPGRPALPPRAPPSAAGKRVHPGRRPARARWLAASPRRRDRRAGRQGMGRRLRQRAAWRRAARSCQRHGLRHLRPQSRRRVGAPERRGRRAMAHPAEDDRACHRRHRTAAGVCRQ